MKRCEYVDKYGERCNKPFRTGRKYCAEHRHSTPSPGGSVIEKATRDYIRFQMNKTFIVWSTMTALLLIAFLLIGYLVNQIATALIIGIPISLIVSIYISIKYFKVRFQPKLDVQNKHPDYVNWVQKKVNKAKEEREFRKKLWR
jgi:hypothetical protein